MYSGINTHILITILDILMNRMDFFNIYFSRNTNSYWSYLAPMIYEENISGQTAEICNIDHRYQMRIQGARIALPNLLSL